jgi:hypothetical protein
MNQKQNKLIKDIEKKCTTIMIGSLARFEKVFGHLWDSEDEIGDKYYEDWKTVRHDVLNFGNNQIRDTIESMYNFFIDAKQNNTYQYEFRFDNKKGDKE